MGIGAALQNHGVEILDASNDIRNTAQGLFDFFEALVERGGTLEIERFAGGFTLVFETRGQDRALPREAFEQVADFAVVLLLGATRETRRQAHFHFGINAARKIGVAANFDLTATGFEEIEEAFAEIFSETA